MEAEQISAAYVAACNAYADAFCEKHGYYKVSESQDTYWVADDVGGILALSDDFADMATIRADIDGDVPKGEWEAWNAYTLDAMYVFGQDHRTPNYRSWLKGCPRMGADTLAHLREAREMLGRLVGGELRNM